MQQEISTLLRCPENGSALAAIDDAMLHDINAAIRSGQLVNRSGKRVEQPIDGGLMRAEGDLLYPIVDQIPVLLRDEAILVNQLNSNSKA